MNDPHTVAVIDFETTGLSPALGARATEIAAVLVRGGRVVDRFTSLMRSGARVPAFIEQLTGISNRMLEAAPPAAEVMRQVAEFTRGCGVVAHNAGFDRAFWLHELGLAGARPAARQCPVADPAEFACTLLLSRRLFPEAPNHRLGTLVEWHGITATGRAHRAMADAEVTAELWLRITRDVERRFGADASFALLCALQRAPARGLARCAERFLAARGPGAPAG